MDLKILRGYFILLLSLFIFTIWGVNLFSLSEIEVDTPDISGTPTPSATSFEVRSVDITPRPFVYFLLKELGYEIDFIRDPGINRNRLMIMLDPPARIPSDLGKDVLNWVKKGNNLLIYFSANNPLGEFLGVRLSSNASPWLDRPSLGFPYLSEVKGVSGSNMVLKRRSGDSFAPVFYGTNQESGILYGARQEGSIFAFSNREFFTPQGLAREDNVLCLIRMIQRLSGGRRISMFDWNPGFCLKTRVRKSSSSPTVVPMKKNLVKYNSLWSLIKANPISWVLVQLLVGLTVYCFNVSRKSLRPLPLPDQGSAPDSFLKSMGRRLEECRSGSFAASQVMIGFMTLARKKLGLPLEASLNEIAGHFETSNPQIAKRLKSTLSRLTAMVGNVKCSEAEVLREVRNLERIRKELKIHD